MVYRTKTYIAGEWVGDKKLLINYMNGMNVKI